MRGGGGPRATVLLLVTSCHENRNKLGVNGPIGSSTGLIMTMNIKLLKKVEGKLIDRPNYQLLRR